MRTTGGNLVRWAGLAAMAAGFIFVFIQTIHPADALSSVATARWAGVHYLSMVMCFLGLLGITGIYARQAERVGWFGLAGYLMFSLWLVITTAYTFTEALVEPLLVTGAPKFVESLLALAAGKPSQMDLGAFGALYQVTGGLYILGLLVIGITTFRAGVLPRWAGGVFAFGALAAPVLSKLPGDLVRIAAVPTGVGLAWMGYALWSERREPASEAVPGDGSPQPVRAVVR